MATLTPIGYVPGKGGLNVAGLNLPPGTLDKLFEMDVDGWREALRSQEDFFNSFGERLPEEMREEHRAFARRLEQTLAAPSPR